MGLAGDVMVRARGVAAVALALASSPAFAKKPMPPPCLPSGQPVDLAYDGESITFCIVAGASTPCFVVSNAGLMFRDMSVRPGGIRVAAHASVGGGAQVKLERDQLTLCRADGGCTSFAADAKLAAITPAPQPIANDAGSLVAVTSRASKSAATDVHIYDVAAGKRIGTVRAGTKAMPAVAIAFVGDTLVVRESKQLGGDDETAWLASKTGKRIASVGGKRPIHTTTTWPVHVDGALWAFGASDGDTVVIQNVDTGAIEHAIAVGAGTAAGRVQMIGDARHLVLLTAAPELVVVDLATRKLDRHKLSACARP